MLNKTTVSGSKFIRAKESLLLGAAEACVPFLDLLKQSDLKDRSLSYESSVIKKWSGPSPYYLSDFSKNKKAIPTISFFSGCGGMDLGLEAVGFEHLALFEFNELFCKTLRKNRPNWKVFGPPTHSGDVSKYDEVVSSLETIIKSPFEGVFRRWAAVSAIFYSC